MESLGTKNRGEETPTGVQTKDVGKKRKISPKSLIEDLEQAGGSRNQVFPFGGILNRICHMDRFQNVLALDLEHLLLPISAQVFVYSHVVRESLRFTLNSWEKEHQKVLFLEKEMKKIAMEDK
ncbi:hypothetical protein ACOSQ3_022861 [Xanthoceras sorbifolium]